jgi:hypothetical protein
VASPKEAGAAPATERWRAVVAISNFTAGAIRTDCRVPVLPPALSREWFDTLTAAAADRPGRGTGVFLTTAFLLTQWRTKGLVQLMEAVAVLGLAPTDESAEVLTRTLHDLLKNPARLMWMGGHAAQWTWQALAPGCHAQLAIRRLL